MAAPTNTTQTLADLQKRVGHQRAFSIILAIVSFLLLVIILLLSWKVSQIKGTSITSAGNLSDKVVTTPKIAEGAVTFALLSPELKQFINKTEQVNQQVTNNLTSNVPGPQGPAGAKGATGATGTTGPAGPSDPCSGLTTFFCQGGNSFGAAGVLGTNDANSLTIRAGGTDWLSLATTGELTSTQLLAGDTTFGVRVAGDVNDRFQILSDGALLWPDTGPVTPSVNPVTLRALAGGFGTFNGNLFVVTGNDNAPGLTVVTYSATYTDSIFRAQTNTGIVTIEQNGALSVRNGASASFNPFPVKAEVQIVSDTKSDLYLDTYSNTAANGSEIRLRRGTYAYNIGFGSPGAGTVIGNIIFDSRVSGSGDTATFATAARIQAIATGATASSLTPTALAFSTTNTATGLQEAMRIDSTSRVGIGATVPTNKLTVTDTSTTDVAKFNGSGGTQCTVVTGTGWSCSSDERLKTNILDIGNGLDAVLALQGVTYNWKADAEAQAKVSGFIAQEVEKILPSLVTEDSNGYKSLNTTGIIPYLVEAVKTQNGRVDDVNKELSAQGLQLTNISEDLKGLADRVTNTETEIEQLKAQRAADQKRLDDQEVRLQKLESQLQTNQP